MRELWEKAWQVVNVGANDTRGSVKFWGQAWHLTYFDGARFLYEMWVVLGVTNPKG